MQIVPLVGFKVRPAVLTAGLLTVFASALLAMPVRASASSEDVSATRAYLQADYALARSAHATIAPGQAALRGLVRETVGGCPMVAAGSPENKDANEFSNEVIGTMTITAYHPDAAAFDAFARAVKGLRWSNHRLTREVRVYATKLKGLTVLPAPNICGDVEAWVADGYQALPESTVRFDKRYFAVSTEAEEVSLRLLAPYEGPAQVAQLRHIRQLEEAVADAEAKAVQNWDEILRGLGLKP